MLNKNKKMLSAMIALTAFLVDFSFAADINPCGQGDPLCVEAPFDSLTSINNLKKCVKFDDSDSEKLSSIRRIRYQFDPSDGIPVLGKEVFLERTTSLKSTKLGSNRIVQAIEAQRGGNCEKDVKIWNISVSLASINRISVSYSTRIDIRDCGHFLGVAYVNDVGSGGADVSLLYKITDDMRLVEESRTLSNQWKRSNWTLDLFRFVLPALGPVGDILSHMIDREIEAASVAYSATSTSPLASTFSNDFQALAAGITSAEEFARDVDLLRAPVWDFQRVPGITGIVELGASESTLQLVERVSIKPTWYGPRVLEWKKGEIKALYELRFPRPRLHAVASGESLWTIASKYYAEPKMFALIESASKLRGSVIRTGQNLVVPYYTELCEQNNEGRIVRPGDSVWLLTQKHSGYRPRPAEFRSGKLRLIYPFEQVKLGKNP